MTDSDEEQTLDQRLRAHYDRQRLDPERLDRILSAAAATPAIVRKRKSYRRSVRSLLERVSRLLSGRFSRLAMVSVLLVGVAITMRLEGSASERTTRTLREAAMNHATRFEPEFRASTVAALDADMRLLPFALHVPERIVDQGVDVIGSRYCSLAGHLAAHVKLREQAGGRPVSLFVASLAPELADMVGEGGDIDGIDVDLWEEGGLFYAYARHH